MFRKRRVVLVLAAVLVAAPAHAQFVRSGGETSTTTCAPGVALCDLNWSVQWFNLSGGAGGFLANAAIVSPIPSPPWAPNIPGEQQWIGAANNGTVGGATRYYFQTTFTAPVSGVVSFGLGWDNRLVGAFVGGSIDPSGIFLGGLSLLGATSPSNPYDGGKAGFCRDSDGVFPSGTWPDCVLNVAIAVNADQSNTLTFVVEGDGTTDGLLVGTAAGANEPPVIVVPPTTVPEPATLGLMFMGLVALGSARCFRRGSTRGRASVA